MSKFNKVINLRLESKYSIKEPMSVGELNSVREHVESIGGISNEPEVTQPNDSEILQSGGRFEWAMYKSEGDEKTLVSVQLMRLWCTQMFVQIAKGKAFTNEADAGVDVILSEDELEQLDNIASKVYDSLHNELELTNESVVVKRKPKKLEF